MRKWVAAPLLLLAGVAHARDRTADEALLAAITADDVAAAEAALSRGADVDRRLDFGATPLARAVATQNAALVAVLLARGAKPDVADGDGVTPLALACELGGGTIVAQLLDARADVRATLPDGAAPLAICARFGPAQAVARMLKAGAPADKADSRGQTPLMWAAASGRTEAIALLLNAGADANRVSAGGFTPLFFAIKSNVPAATAALLAAGAHTGHRGPENTSAAQLAVYQRNWPAAAMLVARDASLTERDRHGNQLLHAAAAGGDVALIHALLAKGADPDGLTGRSRIIWVTEANFGVAPPVPPPTPPLLIAAANGQRDAMAALVAAGADPRFVAADGVNVVLAAAQGRSAAALELALGLAPGADVADANGATALHRLLGGGIVPELAPMLRVLAAHGARDDLKDKRGMTAAQLADRGLTEVKTAFRTVYSAPAPVTLAVATP